MPDGIPHAEPVSDVWGRLGTRPAGLTDAEAAARRRPDEAPRARNRLIYALEELV